ncbi:hypothetical protein EF405_20055 [Cyclobacteriaceae bacterium YHN15]|nr:hypothetical protein EF405_20055 [Cyclobacteriaceae bacterium YHN15]
MVWVRRGSEEGEVMSDEWKVGSVREGSSQVSSLRHCEALPRKYIEKNDPKFLLQTELKSAVAISTDTPFLGNQDQEAVRRLQ